MNIIRLFNDAFKGLVSYGSPSNRQRYATAPKLPVHTRVTRHFMRHQRQLQNAKRSGIGEQETARRVRQSQTAKARGEG